MVPKGEIKLGYEFPWDLRSGIHKFHLFMFYNENKIIIIILAAQRKQMKKLHFVFKVDYISQSSYRALKRNIAESQNCFW